MEHEGQLRLDAARQEWDQAHASEMLVLTQEWNKRWLDREKTWMQQQQDREEERLMAEQSQKESYQQLFDEHLNRVDDRIADHQVQGLEQLSTTLESLASARDSVQTDNKSRVEELRKQFAAALEGTESAHKQAREDMLAEKTEELAALEGALEQERRLHEKSQEDLQYAHQLQLKVLKRAVDDERESTARTQATFEETLRAKYDQLVGALQQRADQEERQRVQRALQQLEAIALSPKTDDAANARSAETAAAEKFQSLVAELRANWQQAEEQRVEQLENRLRVHYETVLEHAQIQVQMALKLNDDADQRWMEDLAHRNKRQIEAMHAFEDKCKRLYEGRLTEHEEQMQEQLAQYEDRILAHAKETAGLQEQTESRLRRMKVACIKWRADYSAEIEKRYEKNSAALEGRYMNEIHTLAEDLATAREKMSQQSYGLLEKQHENLKQGIHSKLKQESEDESERRQRVEKIEGESKIEEIKRSLFRLWEGMSTPLDQKVPVLLDLIESASYSPEFLSKLQAAEKRTGATVPILQLITRREYLLYRLKSVTQKQRDAMAGIRVDDGDDEPIDEAAKNSLLVEVNEVSVQLKSQLQEYEQTFKGKFLYHGVWYLQSMQQQQRGHSDIAFAGSGGGRADTAQLTARAAAAAAEANIIHTRPSFNRSLKAPSPAAPSKMSPMVLRK
jgi:hypothetical protein